MIKMLVNFYSSSRTNKFYTLLFLDALVISASYYLSFALVQEQPIPVNFSILYWIIVLASSVIIFIYTGLYKSITRFISYNFASTLLLSTLASSLIYILLEHFTYSAGGNPISRVIIYFNTLLLLTSGLRYFIKVLYHNHLQTNDKTKVLIYGAGSAGQQLATSLQNGKEFLPCAFIDDDPGLFNTKICGLNVYNPNNLIFAIELFQPKFILLAMPSVSKYQRNKILSKLEDYRIPIKTIPGMADIVAGLLNIDDFQEIEINDLLGRESVPPKKDLLKVNITDKTVMVTGAGGSIGSELCRQIVHLKPRQLLLVEVSEFGLYSIDKELKEIIKFNDYKVTIKPFLASVQNQNRLNNILKTIQVDTLYHAAAYKHVPMVEYNVIEGVRNNIFGTYYTARAAIRNGVKTFILVSTDKAVRPTNVMGATKRMAELVLQGLAKQHSEIRFSMVRFGNVLGSSGSVVPLFNKQIREGGPITVTHPDITRYFMTIPEAALLVIQAGAMAKGGDVFVLDMGEPVKIAELATKMVRLMGLEIKDDKGPNGDIEITYTGLRPGEKLYEELLIGDNVEGTQHPRIMTAKEVSLAWSEMEGLLELLDKACINFDQQVIRNILLNAPTGFDPSDGICDLIWEAQNNDNENVVSFTKIS